MQRGLGISATRDLELAASVAREAERLGYATVWTNDTPGADGVDVARAMLDATTAVRVGIGVVPCDRRPPHEIAHRVSALDLRRFVLGVGAGMAPKPVGLVREAVLMLRRRFGASIALALGAMGPSMCVTAGQIADVVLLNWMTPERIEQARRRIDEGACVRSAELKPPAVAAYVRVALGPRARDRIASEADRYARMAHYRRTFESIGKPLGSVGVALAGDADAGRLLAPYDAVLDETVARALPETRTLEETLEIARACAPKPG
jgi:alkanesulfonate monooxygenase SsuD/methylene tetrahydromethanopterin reductase-like flavin-dependent oxidoreductase (luciferase family)